MVDVQSVLTYLSLISIPIGVFYHIITLNNTRKNQKTQLETRQAALFMPLYETFRSSTFRKQWDDVLFRMQWEDYEDFYEKYHVDANSEERTSWFSIATYFEGIGVLVKRNLIDIAIVDDLLGYSIKQAWERIGPVETISREYFKAPRLFDDFEYLYDELMKYYEKHPELAT